MKIDNLTIIDDVWRQAAACKDTDPSLFYTDENDPKSPDTQLAREICAACIVRDECLEYALLHNEQDGIWGGYTPRERRRMLTRRRATQS